jgi:hypothetical protein
MFTCRLPLSSAGWMTYFQANAQSLLAIPWDQGAGVSDAERDALAASVQAFQLGESGEGKHLLRCAEAYAARTGDGDYVVALRLFLAEEHRHSSDLARFLKLAGLPLIEKSWTDSVFRWLRHLAGLELSISVLAAAEVIALVYYKALREATESAVLRQLCDQVLADEVAHVRFQSERLATIRQHRAQWQTAIANGLHRLLFAGTCLAVWWTHARLYRAGGYGFRRFWRASWRAMEHALRLANSQAYRFAASDQVEAAMS